MKLALAILILAVLVSAVIKFGLPDHEAEQQPSPRPIDQNGRPAEVLSFEPLRRWHGNDFKQIVTSTPQMVVGNTPQFFEAPDDPGRGSLITMAAEQTLADAQVGEPTSLTSCAGAMKWLESSNTPDVAVIDIFLRDGECDEVAEILVGGGDEMIIHAGRKAEASDSHRVFLNGTGSANPQLHKIWQQL